MKKIKIPLIDKEIRIYIGKEEWEIWKKAVNKCGCEDPLMEADMPSHKADGVTWGGFIWINSMDSINTIHHEVQHSLSTIYNTLGCEEEEEFMAYIAGHVGEKVFEWILEEKDGEKRKKNK